MKIQGINKEVLSKKETSNILAKVEKEYFRFLFQFAIVFRLRLDPDFLLRRFPVSGPAAQDQEVQPGEGVLQTSGRTRRSAQVGFSLTKFQNFIFFVKSNILESSKDKQTESSNLVESEFENRNN